MKKLYLIVLIYLFSLANGLAQSLINNHWQLGQVDLNFTSIIPSANTVPNGNYGFATISDTAGHALFYTDGKTVWNKNHVIMTNGSILNLTSQEIINTIIVPNPGNNNQYYIFTSFQENCQCFYLQPTRYTYSLVEFNAANPLGTVVNIGNTDTIYGATVYTKFLKDANGNELNAALYFGSLTSTKTSSGTDYWVIVQYGNKMLSYKIDGSGFNQANQVPVESTFSFNQIYSPGFWNYGYQRIDGIRGAKIKFAPNNTFLVGLQFSTESPADPSYADNYFYKVNFNSTTGIFSNYQQYSGTGYNNYEFEISNNSNNLYFIRNKYLIVGQTGDAQVLVKDLNNNAIPVRVLNETTTGSPSSQFNYIQKDRNGNILLSSAFTANSRNKYIHKIENQDLFSTSTVNVNFVYLNDKTIYKLPQLIPEITQQSCQPLTLTTEPNNIFTYSNYSNITTQTNYNINLTTQDITMKASEFIVLKSNSHVKSGSKYLAKIEACTTNLERQSEGKNAESSEEKLNSVNEIQLYPNPSNSMVTVSANQNLSAITINSLDGKRVFNQSGLNQNITELNISSFEKGIYILTIETINGEVITKKLIKN